MKKAFTLAEVLITLAIIGIVAALTIPTLVSKNQNKQLYTQFMKTYNTYTNAFNLSVAENGDSSTWSVPLSLDDAQEYVLNKYLTPYLKVAKTCDGTNYSDCMQITSCKAFDGDNIFDESDANDYYFLVLADGSSAMLYVDTNGSTGAFIQVTLYIDVNGLKGPNILGRDVFILFYEKDDNDNFALVPLEHSISEEYDILVDNCNPAFAGSGSGCSGRLLKEGGMNY